MSVGSFLHIQGGNRDYDEIKVKDEIIGSVTYGAQGQEVGKDPDFLTINLTPQFFQSRYRIGEIHWTGTELHITLVKK